MLLLVFRCKTRGFFLVGVASGYDVMREGVVLFGEDRYYQLLAKVISE